MHFERSEPPRFRGQEAQENFTKLNWQTTSWGGRKRIKIKEVDERVYGSTKDKKELLVQVVSQNIFARIADRVWKGAGNYLAKKEHYILEKDDSNSIKATKLEMVTTDYEKSSSQKISEITGEIVEEWSPIELPKFSKFIVKDEVSDKENKEASETIMLLSKSIYNLRKEYEAEKNKLPTEEQEKFKEIEENLNELQLFQVDPDKTLINFNRQLSDTKKAINQMKAFNLDRKEKFEQDQRSDLLERVEHMLKAYENLSMDYKDKVKQRGFDLPKLIQYTDTIKDSNSSDLQKMKKEISKFEDLMSDFAPEKASDS